LLLVAAVAAELAVAELAEWLNISAILLLRAELLQ
jgi:hypothetical protein